MVKELLTLLVAFLVFHGKFYDDLLIHVHEHDLKNDSLMFTFFATCIVHETIDVYSHLFLDRSPYNIEYCGNVHYSLVHILL